MSKNNSATLWPRWLMIPVFLLLFGRLHATIIATSPTFDEPIHLFYAAVYGQNPTLRPIVQNPPLIHALVALPLRFLGHPSLNLDHPAWQNGDWLTMSKAFLWQANPNGLQLIWIGRFCLLFLALLAVALLYRYAARWCAQQRYHPLWAIVPPLLLAHDPNFLAHSGLMTADVALALTMLAAVYGLWRDLHQPTHRHLFGAGIALGAAFATKFSAVILLPAWGAWLVWQMAQTGKFGRRVTRALVQLLIALLIFVACYRGDWATLTADVRGQFAHAQSGHSGYLFGELSREGWWYYYPAVFLAKTPLPVLGLFLVGLGVSVRQKIGRTHTLLPLLTIATLFAALIVSNVNLGYRYLLPVLPLLYLCLMSLLAASRLRLTPFLAGGAVSALLLLSGWIHPRYLSFFNLAVGGSSNGWRVALDSNLDWGQELPLVVDWWRREQPRSADRPIFTSYLGTTPLSAYDTHPIYLEGWPWRSEQEPYTLYHPQTPLAGFYALSATQLMGVYLRDPAQFAYFQQRQPATRIGDSFFLYDVAPTGLPTALFLSGIELDHLSADLITHTLASNDLQLRWYDARQAMIWAGGDGPSWWGIGDGHPIPPELHAYLLPQTAATSPDGQFRFHLYQASPLRPMELTQTYWLPPATPLPVSQWAQLPHGSAQPQWGDNLLWLGYQWQETAETLTLITFWRVSAPWSAESRQFVHILDEQGKLVTQQDTWGFVNASLRVGDVLAQTVRFAQTELPANGGVRLGLYHRESGARWTIGSADHVLFLLK